MQAAHFSTTKQQWTTLSLHPHLSLSMSGANFSVHSPPPLFIIHTISQILCASSHFLSSPGHSPQHSIPQKKKKYQNYRISLQPNRNLTAYHLPSLCSSGISIHFFSPSKICTCCLRRWHSLVTSTLPSSLNDLHIHSRFLNISAQIR